MLKLGLDSPELAAALAGAGFEIAKSDPDLLLTTAAGEDTDHAARLAAFVVGGGALAVCGGKGPLLAALHLLRPGEPVSGSAVPVCPGLAPLELETARSVSGVGYCLYRIGEQCVALAGPRGDGGVLYLGDERPAPALLRGCLDWIIRQSGPDPRFISWGPP